MIRTILLLDDDPDEKAILQHAFTKLGIPVNLRQFCIFSELHHFLKHATTLPDMLLLDVNMPGLSGIQVLDFLKSQQRFSRFSIVMHSSSADPNIIEECFKRGANAYMKKGANTETLLHHLKILMDWKNREIFSVQREKEIILD